MDMIRMTCTRWMLISCLMLSFGMSWHVAFAQLFPALKTLSDFAPINSSSTCGTPAIKVCRSSVLSSSLDVCTEDTCKFSCCDSCSNSKPSPTDLGNIEPNTQRGITNGESRPGSSAPSFNFVSSSNSYMDPLNLGPSINYYKTGFTISIWIKQKVGNKGTLFSKTLTVNNNPVIYHLEIENYTIWFHYQYEPSGAVSSITITPLQSQSQHLKPDEWHLITLTVVDKYLSYFIDEQFIKSELLKGAIKDPGGRVRIGQRQGGSSQYEGLMQDIFLYNIALTNREVIEAFSGVIPKVYVASQCRCPPDYPKIVDSKPAKCARNGQSNLEEKLRLASTAHPIELATDGDTTTYWQSTLTETASIYLNLRFGVLQIFYILFDFYGPQPSAIKIERSLDNGLTFKEWQYFAQDCDKSFNMANNGPLPQPDSVNCLQYLASKSSGATITFQTEKAPPSGSVIPVRPFGSPCTNLYCSEKFLEFIKASHVKLTFYGHTLVKNEKHKYFALHRIVVAGRCECFGHAKTATYIGANMTHGGKCICQCESSTFTQGKKCDQCLPLYNKKPFQRGNNKNSYPCIKCQCNQHATSCSYNKTLDSFPDSRTKGDGGVCNDCQHNTMGRYCHICKEMFYRESGKSLSAADVCSPCRCTGPGVAPDKLNCVKDDTQTGVTAGQCECKQHTQGRQCNQCSPGYFDLKSSHSTGCVTCGCNTAGTTNGSKSCHTTTGQCICKSKVMGVKCDTCHPGFYGLSTLDPAGCKACNCDPFGSLNASVCNDITGQCPCKVGSTGRQCDKCSDGYHSLDAKGCKSCNCSKEGSTLVDKCKIDDGQCYCKPYTEGPRCDHCKPGYFNISASNPDGCVICTCDPKGTVGNSLQCEVQSGNCTCKRYVVGKNCNECKIGTYNLSMSNPEGCQQCKCNTKGTQNPSSGSVLGCSSNGQCACLTSVVGKRCDACASEYFWNPSGKGCVSCNCHRTGAVNRICNMTGQCNCKPNIGGLRCDRCLPGNYGFNSGNCRPCSCNLAGVKDNVCDDSGKCTSCKANVEGNKCERCKSGTVNLQSNNSYGCSGAPSQQPPPFVTIISSRILGITWNMPDNPNGVISRFELYRNDSLVYKGLVRAFNDTGLAPNSLYSYYIITYTENNLSTRSYKDNRVYKTPEDAPQNIAPPNITDIKARTAIASWAPPGTANGRIVQYRLTSVDSRSSSEVEHCRGLIFRCVLANLKPFTTYNFTVAACNNGGCGYSWPRRVSTRETAPDFQPMPNITLIPGGQSLIVTWDAPPVPNGKVFRYDLYMRALPFSGPGNALLPNSPVNVRKMTVTKLLAFTQYEFRVVAFTADVSGDTSSSWKRIRTAEGVPMGETAIQPRASAVSSKSIRVTWSPPSSPKGIIVKYIIKVVHPLRRIETNRTDQSLVVADLKPYTIYVFTVTACNSYQCTGESAPTSNTRTLADAPIGQGSPRVTAVDSHSVSLVWSHPQILNGPLPPSYNVTRAPAAFNDPPQEVTAGVHFPGLGYYKFSDSAVTQGDRNDIELSFRTQHPNGLIIFMTSENTQEDLFAVELRIGKPWFVFDCQSGPAAFTVNGNVRFDDNKWHNIKLTRRSTSGTILVDGKYSGSGNSVSGTSVIGGYTGVYVGGLPNGFQYKRRDSGNAVLKRLYFIGCLKNFKSEKSVIQWKNALEKKGVEPEMNGCPVRINSPGALLRGGGFMAIRSELFKGGTFFPFEMTFRSQIKEGLLLFAYGPTAYVGLVLNNGKVNLKLKGTTNTTSYEVQTNNLCDGSWNKVEIVSFGQISFIISVNGKVEFQQAISGLTLQSKLFIGGIPLDDDEAVREVKKAGIDPDSTFSGCVKNLQTTKSFVLSQDVVEIRNVDLDGCVSNATISISLKRGTCLDLGEKTLITQNRTQFTDSSTRSFVDYIYRVRSFHDSADGYASSPWIYTRSGPGDPSGIEAPTSVTPLHDGRSARVTWAPPTRSNGVITHYFIIATDPLSRDVLQRVTAIDVLNSTIVGLTPYTRYAVRIAAFTLGGNGTGPSVNITTLQAAPEGVPPPSAVRFPRMLQLFWLPPSSPNGIITVYNLTVDNVLRYTGIERSFNVTSLEVYTSYQLQLTACTAVGCAISPQATIVTGELPPVGLSLPTLYVLSNDSMRVEWNEPRKPNGEIIRYEIHISTSEPLGLGYKMVYNGSRSDLSATIAGLVTGTLYYVRIRAFSGGGGTFSNASSARTVSGIPSDIPAPLLTATSPYSIHVQILPPRKPNGVITRYELYQDSLVSPVLNMSALSNYTAVGLEVYSVHTFRVIACTFKGCNPGELARGYSGELSPNGTIQLKATIVSARQVKVLWNRLTEPNGNVSYFLVIYGRFIVRGSAVMATELRREYVIGDPGKEWTYIGLLPNSNYEFLVNATNSKGYIMSNVVTGKTPEAAPVGIVPPISTVLSSTSINVTWQQPYLPNGLLLGYTLHQRTKENTTTLYSGDRLSLLVTGLEPFTEYQYRISVSTAAGTGEGNWTSVVTDEDVPGSLDPPRLSPDSKSMVLEWDPPSKPNGIIVQYLIYMNGSMLQNVTGNITRLRVYNLRSFTMYTFAIAACTTVGCKQSVYSRPERTLESVPSGLKKPVVKALSPRSVEIHWDVPAVSNGIITSYKIYRRKKGQQTPVEIGSVNASLPRVYVDSTVQPFSSYEYRVVAFTNAGGGTPSDYANVTTGEGDPENIQAPVVMAKSSSSLLVKWSPPGTPNGYVINYIVRVLETGFNFSMNSSNVFRFNVSGLKPFILYSILIRACTIGDCGESPPTSNRTLPEKPSGQPSPTAEPLSPTSLRVSWNPPTDSNSPIQRYELYRKTMEEPVNDNFTVPATFSQIYSGIDRKYDDVNLGIFSLQRYKVAVITTTGNSTSPTADHRTGPASPLAGPNVNASAVNHTTVIVSWSPPEIKLLRGTVLSYTVYYEQLTGSVGSAVHNYGSVPGNQTSLAVTGLVPSTRYRFWVTLNNKAGSAQSTPVLERTMDGVPEGFGKPVLYVMSSTQIRVSWTPPTTPNGKIVIYKTLANGRNMVNVSANSIQVILNNLIPYTTYNIQVEVCTVYACTKSPFASAKTLQGAPDGLAAPRLTPGSSFIIVSWDPPSRPNGIMVQYKIFRRKIAVCPTSSPPVVKCTYIECNISQELCGSTCFNPSNKICCGGVLHQRDRNDPKKQCCGTAYVTKNNLDDVCCGNNFRIKRNEYQCCYDNYLRVPSGSVCCQRADGGALVGFGDSCCGDLPYLMNGSKVCLCDSLYGRVPARQCCGGKVIASAQICCGDEQTGAAYDVDSSKICCGTHYVTDKTALCCKGPLNAIKVYNYSTSTEKNSKAEKCCSTNKIPIGMSCCNSNPFNSTYQVCADLADKGQTDCGTGVVCQKSQSISAKCNRCDFSSSVRTCGTVKGYFSPTSVPTTPKVCASDFKIITNIGDPNTRSYTDKNLSPHTEYDYYIVGVNPEGNTTSPWARNKTLMASPEGLDPPVATAISASAIRVTWKAPSVSNGILKEYKLTRIIKENNKRTLVYAGLELIFTDNSGLEPFTGYVYELQACTTECATSLSNVIVYTNEDSPSVVSAPTLIPLSSTSINVTWSLPPKPNGKIIRYNISQVINETYKVQLNPNDEGLDMYIVMFNLLPYTNYTFQVTACTKIGCKEGPPASVFTLEAAPQGVEKPNLVATGARAVEASWFEPIVPNGVISKYSLYRNDTLVYNGTDVCSKTSQDRLKCIYKGTGLKPMTLYTYSVAATTKGGTTKSASSNIQTPESSPEGVPLPRLSPRSATQIYAEWDSPQTPNGVIIRYAIIVNGQEHDSGLNKNKVVVGLNPFTKYAFQVKACTSKGCAIGDRAFATTLEAPASGIRPPVLDAKEWNVIAITWDEPSSPNGIIAEYKVERRTGSQSPIIVCLTSGASLSKRTCLDSHNNLKGFTVYEYRILAVNKGGTGTGQWNSVRTLEGPPRGIKQPAVVVINATAVTAKWQEPLEPNGVIVYYELRYQPLNLIDGNISVAGRVDNKTFTITVNVLEPNTDYQFLVTAINRRREGSSSWASAKTKEAPPSDFKPLKADRLSGGKSLRLHWDEPGSPNGLIIQYNIYKDDIKIFQGKVREYIVTKLTPYTVYEFQLEACTAAGCTKGEKQTIFSAEVSPSGQAPPTTAFVNATTVVLTWKQPVVPNGVIKRFDVIRSSSSLQTRRRRSVNEVIIYSTNKTNASSFTYTDTGLSPYTRYKYKIRAVNPGGETDSEWLFVDTPPAPPKSVLSPVVVVLDANRLNVTWSKPQQPNGVMQYYLVHRNGTIKHQSINFYFVDTGLEPYTVYGYTVRACSSGGCTTSQPSLQRTGEAAPGQPSPPVLTALSAIAIRISWITPAKPNGVVTSYKLYESTVPTPLYTGMEQTFTVSARNPYTQYTFYMVACTRIGCTKGQSATIRTLESPPGQIQAPVATVAGSRHVRVEWKPPGRPNGVVTYYILSRDGSLVYNGSDVRYDDYNISPYKVYSYTVTAYNKAGRGVESPVGRNPPTFPGAPDNLTAPILTVLSATSMRVSWSEPGRPNGVISKYVVLYGSREKEAFLAKHLVLVSLQPYTVYIVRIKACTSSVACTVGEDARARTLEAAPLFQGYPVFPSESIKARSVRVTWSGPAMPNGFIIQYMIGRRQVFRPSGVQISYGTISAVYNTTNGTTLTFTDNTVEPYSEYEYRVTSANSVGSTSSGWAVIKTLSDIPDGLPKPEITKAYADRLDVLIKAPSKPNGEIRNYIVKVSGTNISSGVELRRTVSNLQPYQTYKVSVYACTDAGCTESLQADAKTTEAQPANFLAPKVVKLLSRSVELSWVPPSKPNGVIRRYEVLRRLSCSSCEVPENGTGVGLKTAATINGLDPYITYDFIIRAYNDKFSGISEAKMARTLPEDPVTRPDSPPRVNVTGYHVTVDWSNCFILNGPLDGYTLLEKGIIVFLGEKTSASLPNRKRGEYTYEVLVTTIVNSQKKTARSIRVNVVVPNEGAVEPQPTSAALTSPFYETIWFIAVLALVGILLLFLILALCLRKRSGDRTVYVREREPLPPRTKMRSRPPSMTSLYSADQKSMIDMNTFSTGSQVALIDNSGRLTPKADHFDSIGRYERYYRYNKHLDLSNGSVHKFGLDESSDWDEPQRTNSNKDSGMYLDEKPSYSDSDDDSIPRQYGYKREQYFTDTHL